ncbi:hypothetical protein FOQG_14331 [Fusarium oxysporum f. sp. raphani 54005]|uniref:Uncharacterized protein n=3 Tax=Fusarium oxysporum TaxID=5507 RepID=X0CEZ8_FUSOX|nr:hypothetical protein FOZG_08231 [Fusarium oxysporum Fo47]EXA39807.1 hypothetical protein FOVG_08846 [Fusarium oxysporum f. sp. pisi HDV247]EXK81172.1 hypothetical protein FOQG_14331 [Fusarium oxysporum f. sp. raphani 54005]
MIRFGPPNPEAQARHFPSRCWLRMWRWRVPEADDLGICAEVGTLNLAVERDG